MNLPEAVRKQGEQADAIVSVIEGQKAQLETGTPPDQPPPDPTPPPQAAAQPALPGTAAAPAVQGNEEQTWKQKYGTLQGMMNKQLGDLRTELAQAHAQIEQLMDAQKQQATPAPAVQLDNLTPDQLGLSEDDVQVLGPDNVRIMTQMAGRIATMMVGQAVQPVTQEVRTLKETRATDHQKAFFNELARAVPDWRMMNVEKGFLAWLQQPDGLSGRTRQDSVNTLFELLDSDGVIRYFAAYKELSSQQGVGAVVPDTGGSAPPATAENRNQGRVWTGAMIKQFTTDVALGRFRNREEEAQRIQREIDAAVSEGRVTK